MVIDVEVFELSMLDLPRSLDSLDKLYIPKHDNLLTFNFLNLPTHYVVNNVKVSDGLVQNIEYPTTEITLTIDNDTEITTSIELITYTVSFDINNFEITQPNDQPIKHGFTATRPEYEAKDGFTQGWYLKSNDLPEDLDNISQLS